MKGYNIVYKVDIFNDDDYKEAVRNIDKSMFKFKNLGYLVLHWKYQHEVSMNFHGHITPNNLKKLLGVKQWSKFCQGKREFIIQHHDKQRES